MKKRLKNKNQYRPTFIISHLLRSLNYIFTPSSSIISFGAIEMVAGPCATMEKRNGKSKWYDIPSIKLKTALIIILRKSTK